jgi:hypothetical protein
MYLVWAHRDVDRTHMGHGRIVGHVFRPWEVVELEVLLRSVIEKPEVVHLH